MGASKSKAFPISFEEANGRIQDELRKRLEETFRRLSTASGYLPQTTFTRDILGEFVPIKLAEAIYDSFGGTSKGMIYRDLLCGVVLLANGKKNEKAKFLTLMVSEDGEIVKKDHLESLITACDILPSQVNTEGLFNQEGCQCSVEHFEKWIIDHPDLSSFTRWLLEESAGFQLIGDVDPPSFYKTLADEFEVEEKDIMDLEKTYWGLKGTGKFDETTFNDCVSPPLPAKISSDVFKAVDTNGDGHIDLSEMIHCVAMICRHQEKPDHFWFAVFDQDGDNLLSQSELSRAIEILLSAKKLNNVDTKEETTSVSAEEIAESAIVNYQSSTMGHLSSTEYIEWCKTTDLSQELTKIMFDICHLRFGLRPQSQFDEALVVHGCLRRFMKQPGDTVFLISADWFQQWKQYCGYQDGVSIGSHEASNSTGGQKKAKKKKKKNKHTHMESEVEHGEEVTMEMDGIEMTLNECDSFQIIEGTSIKPPQIDNSVLCDSVSLSSYKKCPSLTNEGGRLVKNRLLIEGNDFVLLPELVWKAFVTWYGTVGYYSLALPRTVMSDGHVELYPISFKIYRHTTAPPPSKGSLLPWPLASFLGSLGVLNNSPTHSNTSTTPIITTAGNNSSDQPPIPRRVACYQAAFDKPTTIAQMSEKIEQMLHVKSEDLRLYDLTNEECPQLLEDETKTIDELKFEDGQKILVEVRNKDNSWPEEIISIMNEVKAKDKQKTDSTTQDVHVPEGATGLSNLGNTCFMNSALQCVSNTRPLTQYFREKDHLLEINKDNPLGMNGVMAKRYGDLIQDLWAGSSKSITPLKFRFTVGRCAPHFNGFQQQDAQELLAFVLDGLHEDLNRVKDKAYKELKDSDGRPDDVVAEEAWQYHLSRNQSIIVDLFHGQLKSVVTCKECYHTSVRFDPFTFLSLPLPMESTVNLEIVVVRLDGSQPVRYGVKLELDDKYRQLKSALSELCAIDISRLRLVEVYGSMIRNLPSDSTKIRSVLGGCLYAYEIPPPLPVAPTSRSDSPDEVQRKHKLKELQRQRTLSMNAVAKEKDKAAKAREKIKQQSHQHHQTGDTSDTIDADRNDATDTVDSNDTADTVYHNDTADTVDHSDTADTVDHNDTADTVDHNDTADTVDSNDTADTVDHNDTADIVERNGTADAVDCNDTVDTVDHNDTTDYDEHRQLPDLRQFEDTDEHSNKTGIDQPHGCGQEDRDGFVFAVHRRLFPVEHYITAHQKNRPMLFSTPLVIPCVSSTSCQTLYESVWAQVKRLIIPDPPNKSPVDSENKYPFQLKYIGRDCVTCSQCPWYRFCRGCLIPCDDSQIGATSGYIGVDWEQTALQLKYQSAQERPVDHESMESLKIIDTKPIDLYECFKAFVRQDELGDEESWYCKQCKKHQSATKSLELWRLPPILIIHLKRFQFVNGRWIKSQRPVTFPVNDLNPQRYTVQNGNGSTDHVINEDVADEGHVINEDVADEGHVINEGASSKEDGSTTPPNKRVRIDEQQNEAEDVPVVISSLIPPDLPRIYNLFAISCHSGVLGGGHYTSFAKNTNGHWYYFNDSSCKETTEDRVNEESPYMLFYELQGLDQFYDKFRATQRGNRQEMGRTEDDREFEETIKNLRKNCSIQ